MRGGGKGRETHKLLLLEAVLPEDNVGGGTVLAVVHEDCRTRMVNLGGTEERRNEKVDVPTMPSGFIDSPVKNCQSPMLERTL